MRNIFYLLNPMLVAVSVIVGCKEKPQPPKEPLTYLDAYTISVPGPSGLDLTYIERGFWTVSDETGKVYKLNGEGNVIKTIKIEGFDIEAIAALNDTLLAVVLERTREIVILDTSGIEIKRKKLDVKGDKNSGLEGITFNQDTKHFFVLNEKKPSLLLELDENLEIIKIDTLRFSRDVSGIHFDKSRNVLWILSDENQLIAKTGLNGNLLETINISIVHPEGITLSGDGKRLYIVSDKKEKLYTFEVNQN